MLVRSIFSPILKVRIYHGFHVSLWFAQITKKEHGNYTIKGSSTQNVSFAPTCSILVL
jgi:hypothetical protein